MSSISSQGKYTVCTDSFMGAGQITKHPLRGLMSVLRRPVELTVETGYENSLIFCLLLTLLVS